MDKKRAVTQDRCWPPEVHAGPPPESPGEVVLTREIPSDEALIPALVVRTCEFLRDSGLLVGQDDESHTAVGLEEALRNAVVHGNGRDFDRKVMLQIFVADRVWGWIVQDEGDGFDPAAIEDGTVGDTVWAERGRGMSIMRHFVEQLEYYDNGSTVVGTKRL